MRFLFYIFAPVVLVLFIAGCQGHDPGTEELEVQAIALHESLLVIETQVSDAFAQVATLVGMRQLATPILDSHASIRAHLDT